VILLFCCSFTFCFVVVEVEAEIAVVIEEVRAVLQRDLLVLCPFGGLEYCGVGAPFGTKFTPATPVAYGTCGAGASLRHVRPCAARRGRRAPAVVVVQAALPRGWRWLTPSPERLKWKCGLRRLKGSVPPRIDWLLSITTTFSASSSTFRYAHHYYILLHF
jgi:hypothetical protein